MQSQETQVVVPVTAEDIARLGAKVDALAEQMSYLVERQRWQADLFDEMGPILRLAMNVGARNLGELEQKGYFAFGGELLKIADKVVSHYGAEDVARLGDQVVKILDTVKSLTQPDVLAIANEATDVLHHADRVAPLGVVGMVKASQDDDVQRGMAIMMQMLRQVGRAATLITSKDKPRRSMAGVAARTPVAPAKVAVEAQGPSCKPSAPGKAAAVVDGISYTADGFLTDASQWTRELAVALAASHGVPQLSDAHWKLIDFARSEYLSNGVSPNIRRLTGGTGLSTKEIYAMFPKAPGKTTALISGIPKPAGCI